MTPVGSVHMTENAKTRSADRILCAAVYTCDGLAEFLLWIFFRRAPSAWAPSCAVDTLALLRHSTAAHRGHLCRDALLLTVELGVLGVLASQITVRVGAASAVMATATIVVCWAFRRRLVRFLRDRWAKLRADEQKRRRRKQRRMMIGLVAVASVSLVQAVREQLFWIFVLSVVGAFLLSWVAVVIEMAWVQERAWKITTTNLRLRDIAPALTAEVEKRLAELDTMNVVAYSPVRSAAPFVGSGNQMRSSTLDIDVHRGALDDEGKERVPEEVDLVRLHEFLEQQCLLEQALETTPSRELSAGHRLCVNGALLSWSSDLLAEDRLPRESVQWVDLV